VWQALYSELAERNFIVLAVAMDSRPDASRPWIEAARPTYPCLIDRDHYVADLYQMVNVPQAVWIDEAGRIVRPTETAGSYEGFRAMDRATRKMPEDVARVTAAAKRTYVDAVRDWALKGAASAFAFDAAAARGHLPAAGEDVARAHAAFRLGQHLLRAGRAEEGERWLAEASRLHPDSWNIWRQHAEPNAMGLAAGPEFWARVDALGQRKYYAAVDMPGMPE
jgi:AhpC/TSA family